MKIICATLARLINGYYSYFLKLNVFIISIILFQSECINSQSLTAQQIYNKVSDAVVVIYAYDSNNQLSKQGSGVVIIDSGYVITNYHVYDGCKKLEIKHHNKLITNVQILNFNIEKDILILKMQNQSFPKLKTVNLSSLKIGERVYAIGNPMGLENTISEGIISGFRNLGVDANSYIQITASISPGSSGGAVFNDRGELIGISTMTYKEGQNLNFVIPIEEIFNLSKNLVKKDELYSYWFEFAKKSYDDGDFEKAITYYTMLLSYYPDAYEALFDRGLSKFRLQNYAGAIDDFTDALRTIFNLGLTDNSSVEGFIASAYFNRGQASFNLKRPSDAISDYTLAVTFSHEFAIAYHHRANIYSDIGEYDKAMSDYNNAIKFAENSEDLYRGYLMRGNLKGMLNDNIGAIKDYTIAIKLKPDEQAAYFNRGISKHALGDFIGACSDWSQAGELGNIEAYDMISNYCN